jgi:hypothetical protein
LISKLHLIGFKGIRNRTFNLQTGINIIHGGSCTGKSSIIDALHLLQLYSYYAASPYETHITLSDPSSYVYHGEDGFTIIMGMDTGRGSGSIYRLDYDRKLMQYTETYIINDTVYTYSGGRLRIKDARISRYTPKWYEFEPGEFWDKIGKWKITIRGLPWRNTPHLVAIEMGHWGGIEEATRNVPLILARVISGKIALEDRNLAKMLRGKIRVFFQTVFQTHSFLRGMAILKHIDYKNALGPSKHLSQMIDPYGSNFPWIYLNALRLGLGEKIKNTMRSLGFDKDYAVESTIDNRYYIVLIDRQGKVYFRTIPYSISKALIITVSLYYSNGVLAIDDFDEYLEPELAERLLEILGREGKQVIATSRRLRSGNANIIEL